MGRDEWVELLMIVVAAIVMVVLAVVLVQGPRAAHGALAPQPAAQCWRPYVAGEAAEIAIKDLPTSHGDCMRLLVYSMVSACEKQEDKAERATCYSYFTSPGKIECKPVSCAGGVQEPKEAL